jgi:MFS family permease
MGYVNFAAFPPAPLHREALFPAIPERWLVVGAATLAVAAAYGGVATIGVLMAPLAAEFGRLKADISLAYTLLTIGAALGGLVAGGLADRYSARPLAMAGAAAMGLGTIWVGYQSSLLGMQLLYLAIGFFGFSCLYAPVLTTVSAWFDKGHGLALGIVTAGGALGQAIVPPVFQELVIAYGWREACVILGSLYVAGLTPAMTLITRPPAVQPRTAEDRAVAAQHWPVNPVIGIGLLGSAALFCCILMGVPSVHLISFAREAGFAPATAASLLTAAMIAGCIGRIATGIVIDRLGALRSYMLVSAIQTVAVYFFPHAGAPWAFYLVAVIYGLGFGGVMTAMVCAVRNAVPKRHAGRAMAIVGVFAWAGMGAGGYQGGLCFDLTGNYTLAFTSAAGAGLVNLAALGLLGALIARGRALQAQAGLGLAR